MRSSDELRNKRTAVIEAAIRTIAEHGIAGLSYRRVASVAGVSLALVNYYFPQRSELIASSSEQIFVDYKRGFERAAERFRLGPRPSFPSFVRQAFFNAVWRDRTLAIAWAELMLDAVRNEPSRDLAQGWQAQLIELWTDIAAACGEDHPREAARIGIDLVIGLIFMAFAIGLSEDSQGAVLDRQCSPLEHWAVADVAPGATCASASAKSAATRQRIIGAAIDLLVGEGPAAATFRRIGERAELSLTAAAYHFPSIGDLLCQAQIAMVDASKHRYRVAMAPVARTKLDHRQLAQLTANIMRSEATEFHRQNLAFFANWIEAVRRPELQTVLWGFVSDQHGAWQRLLEQTSASAAMSHNRGIMAEAIFIGKLIRLLSVGSREHDLQPLDGEWRDAFEWLEQGNI